MSLITSSIENFFSRFGCRSWILFSPFLFLYILIIIAFSKPELTVDEPSYLAFANNLLQGFYSPPPPDIDLWHAPGYPLVIAPLVALKIPVIGIRLLNAFFLYASLVLFYKLLVQLLSQKKAFIWTVLLGFYWLAYKSLPVIMSETFVFFLVATISYCAFLYFRTSRVFNKYFWVLSFLIAYLALTRFMFGYVIAICILFWFLIWIVKKRIQYKRSLLIFTFAFLFTLPYLFYTYSLTGRFFYWSNAGGTTIYWISTPYAEEFGDWFNTDLQPNGSIDGSAENTQQKLVENHHQHLSEILRFTGVERDDAFRRKGFENIRNYPVKYFKNWIANIGRLLFNYPQSYRKPGLGMYLNIIPNMFVFVLGALLIVPAFKISRSIPFFMKFLMLLCLIYLAGSSLVSAMLRMFYILIPIIGLWLAYVSSTAIQFKYSDSEHQNA